MVGEQLAQLHSVGLVGPGLNYYRDGRDSVAFHADRELRYLDNTIVAIVTLGAARPFLVRPQGGRPLRDFRPASGDLVVMGGTCQKFFEHAVPKVAASGPRVGSVLALGGTTLVRAAPATQGSRQWLHGTGLTNQG